MCCVTGPTVQHEEGVKRTSLVCLMHWQHAVETLAVCVHVFNPCLKKNSDPFLYYSATRKSSVEIHRLSKQMLMLRTFCCGTGAGVTGNNRIRGFNTSTPHWLPLTPHRHIRTHPELYVTGIPESLPLHVHTKVCLCVDALFFPPKYINHINLFRCDRCGHLLRQ